MPAASTQQQQPSPPGQARRLWSYYLEQRRAFVWGLLALLATNAAALILPRLLGQAIDQFRQQQGSQAVGRTAVIIVVVAVLGALVRIASRGFLFYAGRAAEHRLRQDLFAHLCRQDPAFFQDQAIGDLVSRATNDLSHVRALMGFGVLTLINVILVYGGNLPLLILIDARLSLVALSTIPLLLLLTRFGARAIYHRTRHLQAVLGALSSRVTESLAGISVIRSFGSEQAELDSFDQYNRDYYRASMRLVMVRNLLWPVAGLVFGVGSLLVLGYGGSLVIDGRITLGDFVEFNARIAALAWPTMAIGWLAGMWQRGVAAMERVDHILRIQPQISDAEGTVDQDVHGSVEARGLTLRYRPQASPVLDDVSFTLHAGETLGIVGKTGSGKSSLIRALLRLTPVEAEQLFLDGHDVRSFKLQAIRRAVGYADQDGFLFSASLRDNLVFAQPGASDPQLQRVIDVVQLGPDIQALPRGLHTLVGERGITLSGGQRQRVVLARALLARPRILILDDSLSAVDAETEQRILQHLRGLAKDQTTIIVSHRLSAVRQADLILVLDQGRVCQRGQHRQLIEQPGLYAQLWGRQSLEQDLEAAGEPA